MGNFETKIAFFILKNSFDMLPIILVSFQKKKIGEINVNSQKLLVSINCIFANNNKKALKQLHPAPLFLYAAHSVSLHF